MASIKNLLFFYDYFYPGYKAGGPIQSLTNLALSLEGDYKISIVTSAYDLHAPEPYKGIFPNNWNDVDIPGSQTSVKVFYAAKNVDSNIFRQIFNVSQPDIVYFNNIYSSLFFRQPLKALRGINKSPGVVICPRGMLQKGALAVKPLKKKIYLTYLRISGKLNTAYWHATNEEEAQDIKTYFPNNRGVVIASNIPKPPYSKVAFPAKEPGQLKLVYLSLITEKKNLLLLLQVMQNTQPGISLNIYGPVTDIGYWQQCEALIAKMHDKVQYKGDVQPANVQEVLSKYHALILLTKGENFGHALYESLSVGRPVITSFYTPWTDLQQNMAGANADIGSIQDCLEKVSFLASLDQKEFDTYCTGAHQLALKYYTSLDTESKYRQLFS